MKNIFILSAIILVTSCDPAKRISRIVKRHPELVKVDTVWKSDTIIVSGASKDSTFRFYQHDTVVLKKDNLTVKYFFNKDSTVYIQGKCAPDTIVKYYPVQINKLEVPKSLTFGQKFKIFIFDNWIWMLGLCWLIWKVFGKALKTYFPFLSFL